MIASIVCALGGPNKPGFTITLPDGRDVNFDITTNDARGIARHLKRPYGQGLEIIGYDRPDGVVPFRPTPSPATPDAHLRERGVHRLP